MDEHVSRRQLIKGSAGVTAGTIAALTFLEVPAQAASGSAMRIGHVLRHEAGMAEVQLPASDSRTVSEAVTVPVMGFPDGWQLQGGDRVLVTGPKFPEHPSTAWPLVTRLVGPLGGRGHSTIKVAGRRVQLRDATIQQGDRRPGSRYQAYCVENDRDQTLTCVALRPAS